MTAAAAVRHLFDVLLSSFRAHFLPSSSLSSLAAAAALIGTCTLEDIYEREKELSQRHLLDLHHHYSSSNISGNK
jgi:hypothetical protein